MAKLIIEYYYRCGCHGHLPNCIVHGANSFAEASARNTGKKYKRGKNSLFGSLKPNLGFFPDLLVFDHLSNALPDYTFLKKYIKKAKHILITTDDPNAIIKKFNTFHSCVIDAVVYHGKFDIEEKTMHQVILSTKPLPGTLPTLSYIGSSALLETFWLKCLKPKSLGIVGATTRNWFVAAKNQKVKHTIHTPFFLLERRIINTRFQELINTPEERYNGNV